jgi:hypothetical protein
MQYIKCSNCAHFNEVKSEYLIFCSSCNKKLENNFSDWKRRNPAGSFEDYKRLICVSETEINSIPVKVKTRPKSLKYWIGFTVAFAIFYAVGQFGGEAIVRIIKSAGTHKEILTTDWTRETYGDFGLSFEAPVKLINIELPLPDNVRRFIDRMNTYSYETGSNFTIFVNSIKYLPDIGTLNLEGAAIGSVNEMKLQAGVTDFNYSQDPYSVSDLPGFMQHGTFKKDGIVVEFLNTGFLNGLVVYQVMVAWKAEDNDSKAAAHKVVTSIEINYRKTNQV